MPPPPVVEDLEVIEQLAARRRPRGPRRVVDELDLQRREETLGHGVVPAIAPAAHAAHDPVLGQGALVVAAGVLTGEALLAPPRKRRSQVHPITRDGKWVDGERVTEGSAVVRKRGWRSFWPSCGPNWSHAPIGHCGIGASKFPKRAGRSACWGFRRFETEWCKGRSNSSWSRSSRRTSTRGRSGTDRSGQRSRRSTGWPRPSCGTRRG